MGINVEKAREMEARARELARQNGQPESLWQMFLSAAYQEDTNRMLAEAARARGEEGAN